MLRALLYSSAFSVLTAFPLMSGAALAEAPDIIKATLAEKNAATGEISTGEMRRILASRAALVIDTRSQAEFEAGHIPGSRHIEAAGDQFPIAVEKALGGDRSRLIVLYCNGPYCQASRRMGQQLVKAGFTNVKRYQLGLPVWRALGGPVQVDAGGVRRVLESDRSAVFVDVRQKEQHDKGTIASAISAPASDLASGQLKKIPLPEDDFNRRVIIFGDKSGDALAVATMMSKRPWHNVMFFAGRYAEIGSDGAFR